MVGRGLGVCVASRFVVGEGMVWFGGLGQGGDPTGSQFQAGSPVPSSRLVIRLVVVVVAVVVVVVVMKGGVGGGRGGIQVAPARLRMYECTCAVVVVVVGPSV